jgi:hypothetical protein
MANIINADNGVVSGISGLTTSADNSGVLQFQTSGTATLEISTAGNISIPGTGKRIQGDFSNATIANRVMFQTTTTNSQTSIGLLPNGTSTSTNINLFGGTDPANASIAQIVNTGGEISFRNALTGTATAVPMTFYTGGSERMRIDTSGNVGIGTSSPLALLQLNKASGAADVRLSVAGTLYGTAYASASDFTINSVSAIPLILGTNNTERMRINSLGNLLVGATSGFAGDTRATFQSVSGQRAADFFRDNSIVSDVDVFRVIANDGGGTVVASARTSGVIAARGIQFPVTQSPSGDANTLDDYEEGTFTPTLNFAGSSTGITYANQTGRYTKIGRIVTVQVNIYLSNKGSSTGAAIIGNLPFAGLNPGSRAFNAGVLVNEAGGTSFPVGTYGLVWSDAQVYLRANNGAAFTSVTNSNFTNSTEIYFSSTYETT